MQDLLRKNIEFDYKIMVAKLHKDMRDALCSLKIPYEQIQEYLVVKGTNMIDMMGFLYKNPMLMIYGHTKVPTIKVVKDFPEAIVPFKVRESDVGYDLTIVKVHKKISDNIIMYDTGIKLQVPWGYYVEVLPRSCLSKTGWVLANSVGVIDSSYTGNIYVVLARIDCDCPELKLPFKGFQLIIRKQYHANMVCVESISETIRGKGGFGSTGV